ncbi:ankyrin [Neocallimastix sp. 'constans']
MSNIVKKRKLLRDKITKYLSNDKSNFEDFKSYLIDNDFILSEINNEKFDILTFTIENIKYENEFTYSLIKFIYDGFEYKNINYTIVIKDIPKTPLFSAIVRDKLNIADYLISLNAKIYYINSKNLNIFEYINEYYLEKKVNGRIINFIFNKLNKIENDKNEKSFIIEMCLNVKYSIFKLIPNFVEKKKFNMLKNIFQCYSINNFNKYTRHKCLIDLLMAYKKRTPLSDEKILTYSDQIPIYFEISPDSYEKVIENLDKNTIIKNKLKYNKTVNYEMLKFLLSYEINKNQAILIKINRPSIYEAIITDNRYNLKLDKKLNIFKEFLEIDSDFNHYEIFEKNLNLLIYSNKYFLITIIMNIIKENKILISKIKFYEIIIKYIKISNLLGIEEILKSLLFFENVVLSEDKVNDIIIKLIEYFYKDEKNQNLKSFYRILNILFESRTFNSNIDFENIIKECIKKKKIYLINKIIISMKKYLAKEIIKNIDFGKILLELIKNPDITYDVFQNFWVLIFHSKEINLSQFNFDEIIINALGNNIIGKKIIQGILANLINFDQNNYLVSIECTIMNLTIIDLTNEDNNTKDLTTENTKTINLSNESDNIIDLTKEDKYIIDLTDENSINKYELTNKNNSMNNSNCINDSFKNIKSNNENKINKINNKIGNEYPLVIAFNNCISGNNNGVYEKIYNDLNCYNYKEKEIAIFKTLLEYGADLNIKINNKNTILEESMEKNLHLINKVIFDFLIKENKREEREKEKTFNMKKLEKRKDRNRYNNYIQKEEPYYRKHNKNIFTNKKYILNNKYEKESIDLLNKNNIKRHNYTNDRMVIHQRKRNREASEEIYNEKAKKYKYDKIIKNRTLKYIENKFTPLVSDYLFKKNFDIKKWIDSDNVNREDNYDYTIIYYALLKEDREAIKYIIKIGSNNMISTSIFKHQTIIHVSIFLGLKDIFLDIIHRGQKIPETVNHEEDNTGLFKSIVLNDHFSLYDKKKVINDLCSYIEINKIKIYRNPLVNLMNMKSEDNACKLASFLLKKTNLKVDNTFKDIFKNSLEFAIEYNLYNFVKLLLKKTFRRNYHNFYKALKSAIVKAIKVKNIKILELLLGEFKGNINWFNSLGECPIKLAVDSNDLNMVKLLVERKCNIEDKIIYSRKYSILYYSLTKNDSNVDIIKYFISLEAKMNIENENEFEKLFRRLDNTGKISLLKYFVNCKEKEFMEKFLKYTITFNRLDILKILFENNFNPEQKIEKRTLWKFARNLNNSKLFLYLKRKRQEFVLKNRKNKELRRKKRRLRKKKKQAKKKLNSLNLKENKLIK